MMVPVLGFDILRILQNMLCVLVSIVFFFFLHSKGSVIYSKYLNILNIRSGISVYIM